MVIVTKPYIKSLNYSMKYRICTHLFILLLVTITFFPLFTKQTSASEATQISTLRVGAYENHPKIYSENGAWEGLFPDILEYIASKEGWEIEYVSGTWTECLDRLENREIDMMVDVAYSPEREIKYDFSNEPVLINWGIVYSREDLGIHSTPDLDGIDVAVMKDSIHYTGEDGIMNLSEKFDIEPKFIEVDDYTRVFELLDSGEVDAGVVNRIFGATFENSYNITETPIIINPVELRFAFPKNSPNNDYLIERIDFQLLELKKDSNSIYYQTIDKYLAPVREKTVIEKIPTWIIISLLSVIGLAAFLFITSKILQNQVSLKTRELQDVNKKLNDKVKELDNTREDLKQNEGKLKSKVKELEKMNKYIIGRELKMAELKKLVGEIRKRERIKKYASST